MSWVDDLYQELDAERREQRTAGAKAHQASEQREAFAERWWTQFVDATVRYVDEWNKKGRTDSGLRVITTELPQKSMHIVLGQITQADFRFASDRVWWRRVASQQSGLDENDQAFLQFESVGDIAGAMLAGKNVSPEEAAQLVMEPLFRRALGLPDRRQ